MGFLSRLFSKQPSKNNSDIKLVGTGSYNLQVVGESNYQENLNKICGGTTFKGVEHFTSAVLVHDDNNSYDPNAVKVTISGIVVGYLSKAEAVSYREYMRLEGHSGHNSTCKAKITGGWNRGPNDVGSFGVTLDVSMDFIKENGDNNPGATLQTQNIDNNTILFNLQNVSPEELSECHNGDFVKFWIPKDDQQKIYIFRRRSIGGQGRLGCVPPKYQQILLNQITKGLDYETEITDVDINKTRCTIKCLLKSREETEAKHASDKSAAAISLKAELQKPYKPKNPFSIRIQMPKNHKLKEGQELYLEKPSLEYYVQNTSGFCINFVDVNGELVAHKNNEPKLILSILRAFFSNCFIKFQITSIDTPDKYTLKYIDNIEGKVIVSFDKNL
jgi:hypothetical protein